MSPYDPNKHHRRSIRLKGYDYSSPGYYFVTICIQNRAHLLGRIEHDPTTSEAINQLNPPGKMIQKWYQKLEDKFPNIKCHASIIMPNHFHCILQIVPIQDHTPASNAPTSSAPARSPAVDPRVYPDPDRSPAVRVDPRVYPNPASSPAVRVDPRVYPNSASSPAVRVDPCVYPNPRVYPNPKSTNTPIPPITLGTLGEHKASPLSTVIQWFKTMTTNEYIRGVKTKNWQRFYRKLWQRNYYEHIIRNEKAYGNITRYINNNPKKWHLDTMNDNNKA